MTPPAETSRTVFMPCQLSMHGPPTTWSRTRLRSGRSDRSALLRPRCVPRKREPAAQPNRELHPEVYRRWRARGEVLPVEQLHRAVELSDHTIARLARCSPLMVEHPHRRLVDDTPPGRSNSQTEV